MFYPLSPDDAATVAALLDEAACDPHREPAERASLEALHDRVMTWLCETAPLPVE